MVDPDLRQWQRDLEFASLVLLLADRSSGDHHPRAIAMDAALLRLSAARWPSHEKQYGERTMEALLPNYGLRAEFTGDRRVILHALQSTPGVRPNWEGRGFLIRI